MIIPDSLIEQGISLNDKYLDLRGLSQYASLGISTIRDYVKRAGLPAYKLGGKILIRKSEFDKWMRDYRLHKDNDINDLVDSVMKDLKG